MRTQDYARYARTKWYSARMGVVPKNKGAAGSRSFAMRELAREELTDPDRSCLLLQAERVCGFWPQVTVPVLDCNIAFAWN